MVKYTLIRHNMMFLLYETIRLQEIILLQRKTANETLIKTECAISPVQCLFQITFVS